MSLTRLSAASATNLSLRSCSSTAARATVSSSTLSKGDGHSDGGVPAYQQATAKDRGLLLGPLRGPLDVTKIRTLYETFVDPDHPDTYRWTWCGRFSVPLGLLILERLTRGAGGAEGSAIAYGTSIGWPEVGLRDIGMTPSAPSNLYHFVGYPGVAYTSRAR